jgi:hypothetical protein
MLNKTEKEFGMLKITALLTAFIIFLLIGAAIAPMTGAAAQYPAISNGSFSELSSFSLDQDRTYQPANASSTLTCPLDMISYWKLNETTGSTFADFLGSNNGQCPSNMCPLPGGGVLNSGQNFPGSQGIDVPASADFDWYGSSNYSIELWANIPAATVCDGSVVFVGRHAGMPAWWVGCDHGTNMAVFSLRDSAGNTKEISGGPGLNDGVWHHLVAVHNGANNLVQLYVDGNLVSSETKNFTGNWISQKELNFGYYKTTSGPTYYHFTGALDEIAIYGRALPANEIAYHYEAVLGGKGYCEPVEFVIDTEGPGSVNISPAGPYTFGQAVALTANPNPGYIFFEWSGDLTGSANPATLILDGDKEVTVHFANPVYYTLQVDTTGLGVVNVEPNQAQYLHGSLVTLEAIPEPGWLLLSWSGDLSGRQSPIEIVMVNDLMVTANFIEADYHIYLPLISK